MKSGSKARERHPEKGEPRSGDPGLGFSPHQVATISGAQHDRKDGKSKPEGRQGGARRQWTQRGDGAGALGARVWRASVRAVGARKISDRRDPLLAYINATCLSQKLTYEYEDRYACM